MEIKLSKWTVKTKDELTWYESKEIESSMIADLKVSREGSGNLSELAWLNAKVKLFEKAIVEILDLEGKKVVFSVDWIKGLSLNDGAALDLAMDSFQKKD